MIVPFCSSVVVALAAAQLELGHQSVFGEKLEVPIHGPQAYVRQTAPDPPVDLISRWMARSDAHCVEHGLALPGHPQPLPQRPLSFHNDNRS